MESSEQREAVDDGSTTPPSEISGLNLPDAYRRLPPHIERPFSQDLLQHTTSQETGNDAGRTRRKRSFDDAYPIIPPASKYDETGAAFRSRQIAVTGPSPTSPSQRHAALAVADDLAASASSLPVREPNTASRPKLQHLQNSSSTRSSQPSLRSRSSVSSSRGSSPRSAVASSSGSLSRSRLAAALDKLNEQDKGARPALGKSSAEGFRFELLMRQQPGKGAAVGLSATTFNRLPLVPTPIAQLRVYSGEGQELSPIEVLNDFPYLICSCNLVNVPTPELLEKEIDFVQLPSTPAGSGHESPLAMLCGTRAYSCSQAVDPDGVAGLFFSCWDVSVRQIGEYRLRLTLIEAIPGSTPLAKTISEPFRVVDRHQFPGETIINTPFGRDLQRQGVNVYIPPLGLGASQ